MDKPMDDKTFEPPYRRAWVDAQIYQCEVWLRVNAQELDNEYELAG